ncbi:MAG TPA: beta-propeller domain-containing protein [Allosphingosinicella sp.]
MGSLRKFALIALLCLVDMGGANLPSAAQAQTAAAQPGLAGFESEQQLRAFLRGLAQERQEAMDAAGPPPPPPPPPPSASPQVTGSRLGATAQPLSITNNQVQGVDEGDIVKLSGDILVILRRGRLFTVSLAGGAMRPVSMINAFPPGVDGRGDWYDEMLVAGGRVIVVGYSYARHGTQVNRFRLDEAGRLTFEDSYQLRSNDYYSSRNYATRLIGNRLILYSPLAIRFDGDPMESLPGLARWREGSQAQFRPIASWRRVYVPRVLMERKNARLNTLHSVTSCDLSAPVLDCDSTVVVGHTSRTFFVSSNAVYIWTGYIFGDGPRTGSFLYRMPLDGSRPSAVQARGMPIDQFSFLADARRGALQVVVRADGGGDAMWRPEVTSGDVALLTIPTSAFGDGAREVPLDRYLVLPKPGGQPWNIQNRFVGDHLVYAGGSTGRADQVNVVSLASRRTATLQIQHGVDRIDSIGPDAIVIGAGEHALGFTAIELDDNVPADSAGARVGNAFLLADAREGESRSHAFFFHADGTSADGGSGILGLPVARLLQRRGERPVNSAALLFLNRADGRLSHAGELAASTGEGGQAADACQASCVDWYGNARPIFIGDRLFGLLGYELVEGTRERGNVREIGRTSFAPGLGRNE